jgi:transposase-like protein
MSGPARRLTANRGYEANDPLERILREIRRRTRVVGAFPMTYRIFRTIR